MEPMKSESTVPAYSVRDTLRNLGLRPTRQRIAVARLLLNGGNRHVTAEDVYREAQMAGVSLAYTTVYNILHQFTEVGLVREVIVESGKTWFDTNVGPHMHVFNERTGEIRDLDVDPARLNLLRQLDIPEDVEIKDVDVIIRVGQKTSPHQ